MGAWRKPGRYFIFLKKISCSLNIGVGVGAGAGAGA